MSKIRLIVVTNNVEAAANVGGPVATSYRTFDVEALEVVAFMRQNIGALSTRSIAGAEVLPALEGQPQAAPPALAKAPHPRRLR